MALQKQEVSVNLVQGANTKMNDQINENFNDMENVVYTGNMTAKKMNGYSLLKTIPSQGTFQHLAKRNNELLAISNQGTYNKIDALSDMQKMSFIGQLGVAQENEDYDFFCLGATTRCLVRKNTTQTTETIDGVMQILRECGYDVVIQDLKGNRLNSYVIPLKRSIYYTATTTAAITTTNPDTHENDTYPISVVVNFNEIHTIDLLSQVEKICVSGDDFYFFGAMMVDNFRTIDAVDVPWAESACGIYKLNMNGYFFVTNFLFTNPPVVGVPYAAGSSSLAFSKLALCDFLVNGQVVYGPSNDPVYLGSKNYKIDMFIDGTKLILGISKPEFIATNTIDTNIGSYLNAWSIVLSTGVKTYFAPHTGGTPLVGNIQMLNIPYDAYAAGHGLPSDTYMAVFVNLGAVILTPPVATQSVLYSLIDKVSLVASAEVRAFDIYSDEGFSFPVGTPNVATVSASWDNANHQLKAMCFEKMNAGAVSIYSSLVQEVWCGYSTSNAYRVAGIVGKSKPFVIDGIWYIAARQNLAERYCTSIIRLDTLTPQANVLYGQRDYFFKIYEPENQDNRSFMDVISYNNESYIVSNNDGFGLIKLSQSNPKQIASIELNNELIVHSGINTMYDGNILSESGFIGVPYIGSHEIAAGSLPSDIYQFVAHYSWDDVNGDEWRSGVSNYYSTGSAIGASKQIALRIYNPIISTKKNIKVRVFIRNPTCKFLEVASYYIKDQTTSTLPEVASKTQTLMTVVITKMPNTAGATPAIIKSKKVSLALPDYVSTLCYTEQELSSDTPMSSKCACLHGDRIFYVSTEDDKKLYYSKIKTPGVGFEFPSLFYKQSIDKTGVQEDKIVALRSMDGRLIILKERSLLYIGGQGPASDGTNDDFSDPQLITTDVGCIDQRSVVLSPDGLMFKSDKGIYLLARNLTVSYIGDAVEQWNVNTITSAVMLEKVNEIRFSTLEGQTLVYNYYSKAWSWFMNMALTSACMYNNAYTAISGLNIINEETTDHKMLGSFITQKMATPWVHVNKVQGYQKAYCLYILGTYKTPHQMKISVYYDYETYASEVHTLNPLNASQYNITSRPLDADLQSGAANNGVYQLRIDLARKSCTSVKFVIEDLPVTLSTNTGECFALSNLTLTVGVKIGASKTPASKNY